jgi:predicted TPR repeat methyltransferase
MPAISTFQNEARLTQSSGNIVLDRRFAWAKAEADEGAHEAAADILQQIVAEAPIWSAAWFALGVAREKSGDPAGAAAAFQRLTEIDPEGLFGAPLHLARLGAATAPERAPDDYVRGLFDQYAARFDAHLVDALAYRGPALLLEALRRTEADRGGALRFRHFIDLGCGTGLMARALTPHFEQATGVDLAPLMIEEARKSGLYARLEAAELTAFLRVEPAASADLVIAADVFVYMGNLEEVFGETARVLTPDGLFAFSVQAGEGADWRLGDDMRYFHSQAYVRRLAAQTGLAVLTIETASTRQDAGRDVPGLVCVLGSNRG